MRETLVNVPRINPKELSSRKLWQLAESRAAGQLSLDELSEIIAELRERCHDLNDLQKIITIDEQSTA